MVNYLNHIGESNQKKQGENQEESSIIVRASSHFSLLFLYVFSARGQTEEDFCSKLRVEDANWGIVCMYIYRNSRRKSEWRIMDDDN